MLVYAIIVLGGAGLLFGALLAFAAQKFRVETDPRIDLINEALPGANCGGCGFPGCTGLAGAIVAGKATVSACPVGGQESADRIAEIMRQTATAVEKKVAIALCGGGPNCVRKYEYQGLEDCRAALAGPGLGGGEFACEQACLGYGNCARACRFDALYISADGLPVIIAERCTACGKCVEACPRGVMKLVPAERRVHVLCRNQDRGAVARKKCKQACIACRVCEKNCPEQAFVLEDNFVRIDYEKCSDCGLCASKCPTGAILDQDADSREQAAS